MKFGLLAFFLSISLLIFGQGKPAFWSEVQAFKKEDSAHFPSSRQILFTGSSSFARWEDMQSYFPGFSIINRGFGGSTLQDLIRYADDIIFPYRPKQIVIYCGENDFSTRDSLTVDSVVKRFKNLFSLLRSKFKNVPIVYVSIKPSPRRQHLSQKYVATNKQINAFLKKQEKTIFINIYDKMVGPDGSPLAELFIEDRLHMNSKGYEIWQKAITPHLLK